MPVVEEAAQDLQTKSRVTTAQRKREKTINVYFINQQIFSFQKLPFEFHAIPDLFFIL